MRALAAGGLGGAAFLALWLLAGGGPWNALTAAVAAGGLAGVAWLLPERPAAAVGACFLLAAFSRPTIDLPFGSLRLEQPALAALIALTIWHRRRLDLPPLRVVLPALAAGVVYLVALALSSAVVAEQPAASLRIVGWTALSMAGGLAAALLLAGRAERAPAWFSGSTALVATIGLIAGIGYLLFLVGDPLIDGAGTSLARALALVHEPNLYASLIAAGVPLALERLRARPSLAGLLVAVVLLLGLGLGVTRAAYVGLVVGLALYLALTLLRQRSLVGLAGVTALVLVAGGVGLVLPSVLLDTNHAGLLLPRSERPGGSGGPPIKPPPADQPDTLDYRLQRVKVGLQDWSASPWIGRGAYSYGERHVSSLGTPEVIAVWPVLTLHDAGLIGLGGMLALLGLLGIRLWRVMRDAARGPTAAAFAAASVVLLVAYLATSALHFTVTWLIFGGALATTLRAPLGDAASGESAPRTGLAWRLTARLTDRSRRRRFATFMRLMQPTAASRLLDVGVNDTTWRASNFLEAGYAWPRMITAVAPAPVPAFQAAFPEVTVVMADGRQLPFADGEFDVGFSNAVVEHVGSRDDQRRFVAEMLRTCQRVFMCTPNAGFVVDPHTLLPFAHWLPRPWWHAVLHRTGNGRWATDQMLNPLRARDLLDLFPQGAHVRLERQRVLGLTTVLIAVTDSPPRVAGS